MTPSPPDRIEATLGAPLEQVKTAVIDVLTQQGYDVDEGENGRLTTGYRRQTGGPWNWMLHWRFGTGKSQVEATVAPAQESTTRLTLEVTHEGKDGIFVFWEKSQPPVQDSAENQLRLIKLALRLL
jgi:hypothetical protein